MLFLNRQNYTQAFPQASTVCDTSLQLRATCNSVTASHGVKQNRRVWNQCVETDSSTKKQSLMTPTACKLYKAATVSKEQVWKAYACGA